MSLKMIELNSAFSIPSPVSFLHRNTLRVVGALLLAAASIQSTPDVKSRNWYNLIGSSILFFGVLITFFFRQHPQTPEQLKSDRSLKTCSYAWKLLSNSFSPIKDQRRTLSFFIATSSIVTCAINNELTITNLSVPISTTIASIALTLPEKNETGWIFWGFANALSQTSLLLLKVSTPHDFFTIAPHAISGFCGFFTSSFNLLFHQYVAADYTQGFKNKVYALLYGKDESITLL